MATSCSHSMKVSHKLLWLVNRLTNRWSCATGSLPQGDCPVPHVFQRTSLCLHVLPRRQVLCRLAQQRSTSLGNAKPASQGVCAVRAAWNVHRSSGRSCGDHMVKDWPVSGYDIRLSANADAQLFPDDITRHDSETVHARPRRRLQAKIFRRTQGCSTGSLVLGR